MSKTVLHHEDDCFYFETDHLALVGNKDYSEILKTLVILCAQREKAIKDYNQVVQLKDEALKDPYTVLQKVKNGEDLGIPDMLCVPDIPIIDFSKYDVKLPYDIKDIYSDKKTESPKKVKENSNRSKKLWSTEEQKKLEELLQVYPPEPIEVKRYEKIAAALGNRTIKQVTSRIQKYFLKLYKAGLPVPGRIPKFAKKSKKNALHKHQRNNYLYRPTTFFPDLCVPVVMDEQEDVPGPSNEDMYKISSPANYLMSTPYTEEKETNRGNEKELQLKLLMKIKQEKLKSNELEPYHHLGFTCDNCHEDPLVGIRWHCVTCKTKSSDFCTDCLLSQLFTTDPHPLTHTFIPCHDDKELYNDNETDSVCNSMKNISSSSSDSEDSDSDNSESGSLAKSDNVSYDYLHSNLFNNEDSS